MALWLSAVPCFIERNWDMCQHIVLTFLSDIKTKEVPGGYEAVQTEYTNVEGEMTRSTNESALRYLFQDDHKRRDIL